MLVIGSLSIHNGIMASITEPITGLLPCTSSANIDGVRIVLSLEGEGDRTISMLYVGHGRDHIVDEVDN